MTFECATNLTGYTLSFTNTESVDSVYMVINLPDGGKMATVRFIVTSALNGTSVRCFADNEINPIFSSLAYVYAKGWNNYNK